VLFYENLGKYIEVVQVTFVFRSSFRSVRMLIGSAGRRNLV